MATIPPPYTAGDAPPSYEEVAGKVDRLVGGSTDPQKYLDVASSLSDSERKVLQDGAEEHNPIKTDEDKKKLALGAVKVLSSDDTVNKLKEDAKTASDAVKAIDASFKTLQDNIAKVDQIESTNFLSELNKHKATYRDVLQNSRILAADISQYGSSFDKLIIPLITDKSLSVETRKEHIEKFIEKAKGFQKNGKDIKVQFDNLINDFVSFTAEFSSWGKSKEEKLRKDIEKLDEQIAGLVAELGRLQTALIALGVGLGVGAPIAAVAVALSGPAAPFVLIGSLILFGATAAAVAGISITMAVKSSQLDSARKERQKKEDEIDTIQNARRNLEDVGKTQLGVFRDSVQVLESYWTSMLADAEKAKGWLEQGADLAKLPVYMKMALDEAVQVYSAMAKYLDAYAKGTEL